MRRFITILLLLIVTVGFRSDFSYGDKVILMKDGATNALFIGKSTIEDIFKLFGKTKIETHIVPFTGKTEKPLFGKRQFLVYENLGLLFILEGDGVKYKKYAKKDTCLLDEIIVTSSAYSLDSVSIGTRKTVIINKLGSGIYAITNGVTDSSNLWYSDRGLTLTFENNQPNAKLTQIHRQEVWEYFLYKREQYMNRRGLPLDSVK